MKVRDIMQRKVETVSPEATIRDVAKLIFGRGINGVPVKVKNKVVGFVTEKDILAKFFPSVREYMEDPVNEADFETMEKKTAEVFKLPVGQIMSKNPVTVSADTAVLRAQALMTTQKVGRLPVVDSNGTLIGILSKGDIFRGIIGKGIPFDEEEGFYDWLSKDNDKLIDWKLRIANEIPDLVKLFNSKKVKKVLDVASSTGEHSLELANKGFNLTGIDTSGSMHAIAEKKREKVQKGVFKRVKFITGKYGKIMTQLDQDYDAAIFMGNALGHVLYTDKDILKNVSKVLNKKSVIVMQIINADKILKTNKGFREFKLVESSDPYTEKQIFLGFYSKEKGKILSITRAVFNNELGRWVFRKINSTPIINIDKKDVLSMLREIGFKKVKFFGGNFYGPMFRDKFDPVNSDWLNVVAVR